MREIIFRGKRTNNGEWVEGSLIRRDLGCFIVDKNNRQSLRYCSEFVFAFDCVLVKSETVGQYTGLTDKNDNKVFEGDIVKIEHNDYVIDGMTLEYRKEKGVIAYDNIGSVGLIVDRCKHKNVWSDFFNVLGLTDRIESWSFEIIGNIHDNPELLKPSLKPEYRDGDPDAPICPNCRTPLREMEDCDCGQKIDWSEEE